MSKLWFKAKEYGWGWYPVTWQGWLVVLGYVGALAGIFFITEKYVIRSEGDVFIFFLLPVAILTILMLYICYKKGEKPSWRWGEKRGK